MACQRRRRLLLPCRRIVAFPLQPFRDDFYLHCHIVLTGMEGRFVNQVYCLSHRMLGLTGEDGGGCDLDDECIAQGGGWRSSDAPSVQCQRRFPECNSHNCFSGETQSTCNGEFAEKVMISRPSLPQCMFVACVLRCPQMLDNLPTVCSRRPQNRYQLTGSPSFQH